jgi:hypothetical protein
MHSARSKIVLLAALAALIGSIAWMAWRTHESPLSEFAGASSAAGARSAATELDSPARLALNEHDSIDAPPTAESPRTAVDRTDDRTPSGGPRVVLRGKIESTCPNLERAHVRVRFAFSPCADFDELLFYEATAYPRADGSFAVDVSHLVFLREQAAAAEAAWHHTDRKDVNTRPQVLAVSVGHPDLEPALVEVPLGDPERWRGERTVELTTVVPMPWQHVTLVGSAASNDGGARFVEFVALRIEDGRPSSTPEASVLTKSDARFRLELKRPGEFLVVAFTDGYRPHTVRAKAHVVGEYDVGHIELDRGVSVRGRVAKADHTGVSGATVSASPRTNIARIATSPALVWTGETCEWSSRSVLTGADGSYEIVQLGPGAYSLVFAGVAGTLFGDTPALDVTAPSSTADLVVGADACEIHLVVFVAGRPGRASFTVHQTRGGSTSRAAQASDDDGNATLYVDPKATSTVEVGDHTFPVPDCTAGRVTEMRIDLEERE